MLFFLRRLQFIILVILFSLPDLKAQECSSIEILDKVDECQFFHGPGWGVDQNCECVPCGSNPTAVGCEGDGEVPVPIDDYVWVMIGIVVMIGVFRLRTQNAT